MIALKCLIINLFNYLSLYLCINLSENYGGLLMIHTIFCRGGRITSVSYWI